MDEYDKCLDEARPKFDKLRKYDLANITLLETGKYNDKYAEALKIYFEDFSKKYCVFQTLIEKFELFTLFRTMFRTPKQSERGGCIGIRVLVHPVSLFIKKLIIIIPNLTKNANTFLLFFHTFFEKIFNFAAIFLDHFSLCILIQSRSVFNTYWEA